MDGDGDPSPLFYYVEIAMLKLEEVREVVKSEVQARGLFLVDLAMDNQGRIDVDVDSEKGVTIKECMDLNRALEAALDREKEDFELTVASPGLGQPLKVVEQYLKNVGKKLDVVTLSGEKITGILLSVEPGNSISLEVSERRKLEGAKKKKTLVVEQRTLTFEEIKSTKVVISFK